MVRHEIDDVLCSPARIVFYFFIYSLSNQALPLRSTTLLKSHIGEDPTRIRTGRNNISDPLHIEGGTAALTPLACLVPKTPSNLKPYPDPQHDCEYGGYRSTFSS